MRDIESFTIVNSSGEFLLCDRLRNSELFGLAIGGYGCFGVVYSIKIRLVHRTAVRRTVRLTDASNAVSELENSRSDGATHGDFQFAIDHASPNFLRAGIVSTYKPIENSADSIATQNKLLRKDDWENLLYLAHEDKSAAFEQYSAHYLKTDGQIYWSDTFQLSTYLDGYHSKIDARTLSCHHGTEVISELYVPRRHLDQFLARAAQQLRECGANVIYGTVRLIEADDETFLAWARKSWACTVFNLHVGKTPEQIQSAATAFRMLIDLAIDYGGSYYLTYHRFANAEQLLACYPQIHEFFRLKAKYDPDNLFYSDWLESIARLLNLPISIRSGVRTHFSQAS